LFFVFAQYRVVLEFIQDINRHHVTLSIFHKPILQHDIEQIRFFYEFPQKGGVQMRDFLTVTTIYCTRLEDSLPHTSLDCHQPFLSQVKLDPTRSANTPSMSTAIFNLWLFIWLNGVYLE
jgi:hypothetical protein